jgi:2-amino-4-hydroxy-6-hydroxymethyldihydropteridine diphosphokinase
MHVSYLTSKEVVMVDCYIGLGGNFSQTLYAMRCAVKFFKKNKNISCVAASRLYLTKAVSNIEQADYLNAVCRFNTTLSVGALLRYLSYFETILGKKSKPKNAPRLIDLDLLFYGDLISIISNWIVPHPRWHERLFVLAPLADVTDAIPIDGGIAIHDILSKFSNPHREEVHVFKEKWLHDEKHQN